MLRPELGSLDEEGRMFLVERALSIPDAIKLGLSSFEGRIYFPFIQDSKVVRWKFRSIHDKKVMGFLPWECEKQALPFFNQIERDFKKHLIITEGEFDALSVAQCGFESVVSLPNGASSVRSSFENNYHFLQGFEEVYICFDQDESGKKASEEARKLLPASKFRNIVLPCKDANDWVREDINAGCEAFHKLMLNAERVKSECVVHFRNAESSYFHALQEGTTTGFKKLDGFLSGLRLGECTVITADTGVGKTTFCLQLLFNLAKEGKGVWINSYEMKPEVVLRKFSSFILGYTKRIEAFTEEEIKLYEDFCVDKKLYFNPKQSKSDLKSLREQIECAKLVYDVDFVLIDHLDYISSTVKKANLHEAIDDAVREIHALCLEFNIHVLLVVHPVQGIGPDGEVKLNQLKGSAGIKQYADNILTLQRMDRNGGQDEKESRVKVNVRKNRMFGKEGFFFLYYDASLDGYLENPLIGLESST